MVFKHHKHFNSKLVYVPGHIRIYPFGPKLLGHEQCLVILIVFMDNLRANTVYISDGRMTDTSERPSPQSLVNSIPTKNIR